MALLEPGGRHSRLDFLQELNPHCFHASSRGMGADPWIVGLIVRLIQKRLQLQVFQQLAQLADLDPSGFVLVAQNELLSDLVHLVLGQPSGAVGTGFTPAPHVTPCHSTPHHTTYCQHSKRADARDTVSPHRQQGSQLNQRSQASFTAGRTTS